MTQKRFPRLAASALALGLITSSFGQAAAAVPFRDVPADRTDMVQFLSENELFHGISENEFGWNLPVKRLDAAMVMYKALGPFYYAIDARPVPFTDVPKRAVAAVAYLQAFQITNGKTATAFGVNDTLTRGEFAIMASRVYDKVLASSDQATHSFTDVAGPYKEAVDRLYASGVTSGISETAFGTSNTLKRSEFAVMVFKLEQLKLGDVEE